MSTALGGFLNAGVATRKGDQRAATDWMRRTITSIQWEDRTPVRVVSGWKIYTDDCLSMGWASTNQECMYVVFGTDTWLSLQMAPVIFERVLGDLMKASSGLKLLNASTIADLVKVQEWGVEREDVVVRLEKLARQLLKESSSINARDGVSAREISEFTLRSGQLQEEVAALELRMANLRAIADASTDAVDQFLGDPDLAIS